MYYYGQFDDEQTEKLKNEIVFIIDKKIINDKYTKKIIKRIKPDTKTGLDMKKVKTLNSALFIKCLIEDKFKLYNLNSEILTYLSIVLKDGKLKSYINFKDFIEDKRELIRRRFFVAY